MNNNNEYIKKYSLLIREVFDSTDIYFYWKGRVALFALLKAMGVKEGDEVIIPAFTCIVVPNAILYLGAKPVYVDICEETYTINPKLIKEKISEKTRVIVCQNTFGFSGHLGEINSVAKNLGIYTIEDCAHGFGGEYNGLPNGTVCDAAFFSTQWNKPFSTGVGGFAITNNESIADKLKLLDAELLKPTLTDKINLRVLYFINRYFVSDYTYWFMVRMYRYLSDHGLVLGSSNDDELSSTNLPERYFRGFSDVQAIEGVKSLNRFKEILERRRMVSKEYSLILRANKKKYVSDDVSLNHSFLKYPVLAKNRDRFMREAEKSKISLGDWFLSPLHPYQGDFSAWSFRLEDYPVANYVSKHIVNLPTNPKRIKRVLSFLNDNLDEIL